MSQPKVIFQQEVREQIDTTIGDVQQFGEAVKYTLDHKHTDELLQNFLDNLPADFRAVKMAPPQVMMTIPSQTNNNLVMAIGRIVFSSGKKGFMVTVHDQAYNLST